MNRETSIIYADPAMYAGWPANHGAWQWGDEWLVGFLRGSYREKSMHNIAEPYEYCFARSLDEGKTWSIEPHGQEFEAGVVIHAAPPFDMKTTIRRVCGVYDHGGDNTDPRGGFFLSSDRGHSWHGPYLFNGLSQEFNSEDLQCTGRQCELPDDNLLFLSNAQRFHWGTDRVFVAQHDGLRFRMMTYITDSPGRVVMPAVAKLRSGRVVVACRRRDRSRCWIDCFISDDNAMTWSVPLFVAGTGGANGNPPALIESEGVLYCAFGDRRTGTVNVVTSRDGEVWSPRRHVARGAESQSGYFDLGYPRLFKRRSGQVCVAYYIATADLPQQHIALTEVT